MDAIDALILSVSIWCSGPYTLQSRTVCEEFIISCSIQEGKAIEKTDECVQSGKSKLRRPMLARRCNVKIRG